mgnify:FL=1
MFFYNKDCDRILINPYNAIVDEEFFYFYYYDKEFINVDWAKEPQQSLKELYRLRAEQIRNEYEYVIIPYSGGYKSSLILETFYYNNIHIDEILLVGAFSQDSYIGSDENHNGEIYKQAIPTLNKLNLKNTKITQADYSQYFNDPNNFSLIKNYGTEWIKHIGLYYSPHNLFWHDLKKFIGQNNDKKTAVIFGTTAQVFQITDNSVYTYFPSDVFYNFGNFQVDENFNRINFFEFDIIRKQLHIILNFVKNAFLIEKNNTVALNSFRHQYSKITNKFIYQLRNPIIYQSKKSSNNILSRRDAFLTNKINDDIYKVYRDGIKTYGNKAHTFLRNELNFYSTTSSLKTRKYFLLGEENVI